MIIFHVIQFRKHGQDAASSSVLTVFGDLTQRFDVVSKLDAPNHEIRKRHTEHFVNTVLKMAVTYTDLLKTEFKSSINDERIVILQN